MIAFPGLEHLPLAPCPIRPLSPIVTIAGSRFTRHCQPIATESRVQFEGKCRPLGAKTLRAVKRRRYWDAQQHMIIVVTLSLCYRQSCMVRRRHGPRQLCTSVAGLPTAFTTVHSWRAISVSLSVSQEGYQPKDEHAATAFTMGSIHNFSLGTGY